MRSGRGLHLLRVRFCQVPRLRSASHCPSIRRAPVMSGGQGLPGGEMIKSLCGRFPCPGICERVCHCPAGLERSHFLAGAYRNRRLAVRGGLRPPRSGSQTRPPTKPKEIPLRLSVPEFALSNLFGRDIGRDEAYRRAASRARKHNITTNPTCLVLTALLAFIGIVVLLGVLINQGNF